MLYNSWFALSESAFYITRWVFLEYFKKKRKRNCTIKKKKKKKKGNFRLKTEDLTAYTYDQNLLSVHCGTLWKTEKLEYRFISTLVTFYKEALDIYFF